MTEPSRARPAPTLGRVERTIRNSHAIVLACCAIVAVFAAFYTLSGVGMSMSALEMTRMARPIGAPMQMGPGPVWTPGHAVLIFLMWWIMMIAMMTPSAAPALLLFTAIKRTGPDARLAPALSGLFLAGYLIAWALFSAAATLCQWGLEHIGLAEGPMMTINSAGFAGLVLILAGLYQFSTLKQSCLALCQSPAEFLVRHNYPGGRGAFRIGVEHGVYCLGCCWALMALLFVGGIMNLYWIVGIAIYVALEKLLPRARWLVPGTGILLMLGGAYLIGDAVMARLA